MTNSRNPNGDPQGSLFQARLNPVPIHKDPYNDSGVRRHAGVDEGFPEEFPMEIPSHLVPPTTIQKIVPCFGDLYGSNSIIDFLP